jgi:putative transposase
LVSRGLPAVIVVDNAPEFTGKALDAWAYARGVQLRFIRPGKPVDNAFIESVNGKFRDACLNEHWFRDLTDARDTIEAWRQDYNDVRPHSAWATAARGDGGRRPRLEGSVNFPR